MRTVPSSSELLSLQPDPLRIEAESCARPFAITLRTTISRAGDFHLLVGAGGAVVQLEGDVDRQDIKTAETDDRPRAVLPQENSETEPRRP